MAVDLARVAAVIDRIAAHVDELAPGPAGPGPRHRRGAARPAGGTPSAAAEPDLEFRAFCARKGLPASSPLQLERACDAWQAERYQRGETGQRPGYTDNPFRPR